jgi:hypothetical protein
MLRRGILYAVFVIAACCVECELKKAVVGSKQRIRIESREVNWKMRALHRQDSAVVYSQPQVVIGRGRCIRPRLSQCVVRQQHWAAYSYHADSLAVRGQRYPANKG